MNARGTVRARVLATLALCVPLGACTTGSMDDLQSYSREVLARESRKVDPLPEIKPYEVYSYQSALEKDPFEPFFRVEPDKPPEQKPGTGVRPPENHVREELEQYPLDALRMVGTLDMNQQIWAIVLGPDRTVYRVQTGNYMGRNYGKIIGIEEDRIDLTEIVSDGLGGYVERQASLALIE